MTGSPSLAESGVATLDQPGDSLNPRDPDTDDLVVHFWRGSGGTQNLTYPAKALFITSEIDRNAVLNADDSVLCIYYGSDGAIFQDIPAADVRH